MSALGILDWGIGGAGLVRALRRRRPEIAILYWSDTGVTPYGKLSRRELGARVRACVAAMERAGASHVAVACNAASTVLSDLELPIPAASILEHGVAAVLETGHRRVGVIGGVRTIRSGVYRRALERSGVEVHQRIAQPLSALIEAGVVEGPALDAALAEILRPLPRHLDALLLACTHYPAIAPALERHLPELALVDPAARMAEAVLRWPIPDGPSRFLTTGEPEALRTAALRAYGVRVERCERAASI